MSNEQAGDIEAGINMALLDDPRREVALAAARAVMSEPANRGERTFLVVRRAVEAAVVALVGAS